MKHIITILFAAALFGCAGQKPIQCPINVHSAVEQAIAACEIAAQAFPEEKLGALTAEQWCNIAGNAAEFVEAAMQCEAE